MSCADILTLGHQVRSARSFGPEPYRHWSPAASAGAGGGGGPGGVECASMNN